MKRVSLFLIGLPLVVASCAGVRSTGNNHTSYAYGINLVGYAIPVDDQEKAWSRVPEGAEVTTVVSTPRDWTSLIGILTNILGISQTQVSWTGGDPL